jgi:signal transduction histidine kinase
MRIDTPVIAGYTSRSGGKISEKRLNLVPFWLILIAILVLPWQTAEAQKADVNDSRPGSLILTGDITERQEITRYVSSLADETRSLNLQDILNLPDEAFAPSNAIPSFGYTRDVIWHRLDFTVETALGKRALLEIAPNYLNFIDLYLLTQGSVKPISHTRLGDHIPVGERQYDSRTNIVSLPLLEPGDYRLYVRSQSNSANLIWMTLWPTKELISSLSFRYLATNIFFGFIVTLCITYLALGLIAGDRTVILYSIWVGAIGTTTAIVNGVVLSEWPSDIPWLNDFLLGSMNIITYGVTVFLWLYIIEAKRNYPRIYRICCAYGLLILVMAAGATTDLYTLFGTYIIPSHSLFMTIMCLILVHRAFTDYRNRQNWAFLVVLIVPTGAAIMIQLALSGVIEATRLRLDLHQVTLLFHLVGMGIMMTVRLSRMDQERVKVAKKTEETTLLVEEQRKLVSMLSHEFRTPLAVIQRSAEMLMLRLKNHNKDVIERLQRIQLQAQKLARLVDIFLTKDGIETQDFSLARETVPANRFLQEFAAQTTREGAEVRVNFTGTSTVDIYIDETLMGLAITNLIETSRRFAHGRPIDIHVYRQSESLVEISIPCRGDELDEAEIGLIADALFRRDMETHALRRALGLHISQRIVDAHGGSISLRQNRTHSIELCVLLPCE